MDQHNDLLVKDVVTQRKESGWRYVTSVHVRDLEMELALVEWIDVLSHLVEALDKVATPLSASVGSVLSWLDPSKKALLVPLRFGGLLHGTIFTTAVTNGGNEINLSLVFETLVLSQLLNDGKDRNALFYVAFLDFCKQVLGVRIAFHARDVDAMAVFVGTGVFHGRMLVFHDLVFFGGVRRSLFDRRRTRFALVCWRHGVVVLIVVVMRARMRAPFRRKAILFG